MAALSAEGDSPDIGGDFFTISGNGSVIVIAPTICFYFTPFFGCAAEGRGNFTAFDRNLKSHVYPDVAIVARSRHTG